MFGCMVSGAVWGSGWWGMCINRIRREWLKFFFFFAFLVFGVLVLVVDVWGLDHFGLFCFLGCLTCLSHGY